jgi:carboxypeptidase Taq
VVPTSEPRQCAALYGLAHEQAVAPALGKLLDALARYGEMLPRDSDDASLIRVARRDFQKMIKIPPDHVRRANAHGSASYNTWTRARPANNFAALVPYLERTLDLSREYSSCFAPYKHVADPHIDDADEGMTTASIRKLFSELKSQLVPMVGAICEQPVAEEILTRSDHPSKGRRGMGRPRRLGWCRVGVSTMTHGPAPCTGMVDEALKRPPSKPADSLFGGCRCSAASFLGRL